MSTTLELKKELQKIQDLVTNDVAGIIWISSENLDKNLPYFYAFDYLVDGALRLLEKEKKHNGTHLVMAKSFNHSFFLAHLTSNDSESDFTNILDVISPNTEAKKILILGSIGLNTEERLQKKAPHLTFEFHAL